MRILRMAAVLIFCATGITFGNPKWWNPQERQSLLLLEDNFSTLQSPPWTIQGQYETVKDEASGKQVLEASDGLVISLAQVWESYTVTVEIKLGTKTAGKNKAALQSGTSASQGREAGGYWLGVEGDKNNDFLALVSIHRGKEDLLPSAKERSNYRCRAQIINQYLKPDIGKWRCSEEVKKEAEQDFEGVPKWKERWFALRIESTPQKMRFYLDGRFLYEIAQPHSSRGGIALSLSAGGRLRRMEVVSLKTRDERYVPVALTGYVNDGGSGNSADVVPESCVAVAGRPFVLAGTEAGTLRSIDVGRTKWRRANDDFAVIDGSGDNARMIIKVPPDYYSVMWVICSADRRPGYKPAFTANLYCPRDVNVPCERGAAPPCRDISFLATEGDTTFWLVRVPLNPLAAQQWILNAAKPKRDAFLEYRYWMELEISRELLLHFSYPDPTFHEFRPFGMPSAVHIYALTLEKSPVEVTFLSTVPGNVFEQPEIPAFEISVKNNTDRPRKEAVTIETEDSYGATDKRQFTMALRAHETVTRQIRLRKDRYGWFSAIVRMTDSDISFSRRTTFAWLPLDTRKATPEESPFGIWTWGGSHNTPSHEYTAALLKRAGARWQLGPSLPEYNVWSTTGVRGMSRNYHNFINPLMPDTEQERALALRTLVAADPRRIEEEVRGLPYPRSQITTLYGESCISLAGTYGIPSEYTDVPRDFDEEELRNLRGFYHGAIAFSKHVKERVPGVQLVPGNGDPRFLVPWLKYKYPNELLDGFGVDLGMFERMPERPPRAVGYSSTWFLYDAQRRYGYQEIPIFFTEAMYYSAMPGSLTLREQADYYVRTHLLGFALGVRRFCMTGMITSCSGPYGNSFYGSSGYTFPGPAAGYEANPKMSYVAYATMTRMLDRARFSRWLPTGSLSAFLLEFHKGDGSPLYAAWTTRGTRDAVLRLAKDAPVTLTDMMSNPVLLRGADGSITVPLSQSPVWIAGARIDRVISLSDPVYTDAPRGECTLIDDFKGPDLKWRAGPGGHEGYENNNFDMPRTKGNARCVFVNDRLLKRGALEVAFDFPERDPKSPPLLIPLYFVLGANEKLILPSTSERPGALGIRVRGDSGWGRIIFEVTDAKGETWISVGPKDGWNNDDPKDISSVNFDNWRYIEIGLPSTMAGTRNRGAMNAYWGNENGDGIVDYPLVLTRIIVEARSNVVYVSEAVPVREMKIGLADLVFSSVNYEYERWGVKRPVNGVATEPEYTTYLFD